MSSPFRVLSLLSFRAQRGICLFLTVTIFGPAFSQEQLPHNWRKPTGAESPGKWRQKSASKFLVVRGDFDGDDREDRAELLINESGRQCGLFVQLSGADSDWQSLWEGNVRQGLGDVGIDIVRPGKYETLCGSDPSECDADSPRNLYLRHGAIELFFYGTTRSFFYWDRKRGKFRTVAIGD